jgi:streptogramin lyase
MLALYRSGRQAEALEAYRHARTALGDELGLEPSPSLRRLEQAILAQDPALGEPSRLPPAPHRRRRRVLFAVVAGAAAVAVGVAVATALRDDSSVELLPDSVLKIDPASNEVVESFGVGGAPGQVRVLADGVFVTSVEDKTLTRIDVGTGEQIRSGEHAAGPGVAAAGEQLWVASESRGEVTRVSPSALGAIARISLGAAPGSLLHALPALGAGSLWVSEVEPSAVTRWSLRTHALIRRYELAALEFPVEIVFGDGAAWIALNQSDEILRIDAVTGAATRIGASPGTTSPVLGFGAVWVGSTEEGTVWRIDSVTERVRAAVQVGRVAFAVAVGDGSVWATDYCRGAVVRIDPESNEIVARIETGYFPRWLAFGAGHLWVGVAGTDTFDFPECTA